MSYCATAQHTLVPDAPFSAFSPIECLVWALLFSSEADCQVSLASNQDLMGEINRDLFGDGLQVYYPDSSQSMFVFVQHRIGNFVLECGRRRD